MSNDTQPRRVMAAAERMIDWACEPDSAAASMGRMFAVVYAFGGVVLSPILIAMAIDLWLSR